MPAKKTSKTTAKTTTKKAPKKNAKKVTSVQPAESPVVKSVKSSSAKEHTSVDATHSKIVNVLVLILLSVVALSAGIVVGDYVFSKSSFGSIKMPVSIPFLGGESQTRSTNQEAQTMQNEGRTTQERPTETQNSITLEGVEIKLPNDSSSDEDLMQFGQQITSLSRSTDTVSVGEDCELTPAVPKVTRGGSVTFTNTTTTDVELFLLEKRQDLRAGGSFTFEVGNDPMTTGISCSGVGMAGFLHIE